MKPTARLLATLTLLGWLSPAHAGGCLGKLRLQLHNLCLHGHLDDYTDHHGADRRIWSEALQARRSVYVYLPPGYDPSRRYPMVLWLHGIIEDNRVPLINALPFFDQAIAKKRLPPTIVVIPDGRIPGRFPPDSHFLNTRAGRYEDYLLYDVLPFVMAHYPICPEREAHAIVGFSLSGWASYSVALKNTHFFGAVASIMSPLNMRWVDCHGKYKANFDPCCWGWRNELCKDELITYAYGIKATLRRAIEPYFGWGPEGLAWLSSENPIELLERYDIQPGQIAMYVAYIRHDEYNVDAQVESFLYLARQRGLCVTVNYDPHSPTHNVIRCIRFFPATIDWLAVQFAPFACPGYVECPAVADPE